MNLTCACPTCDTTIRAEIDAATDAFSCDNCGLAVELPPDAVSEVDGEQQLHHCLVCPSRELFIRKDFPQRLGIAIVVAGFVLSSIAWYDSRPLWAYAILFLTAGIDVLLYITMGEALVCYRCNAHYRGLSNLDDHAGFNLETHERYRQLAARQQESAAAAHTTTESASAPRSG
ncbi:MAG: hypothetical protein WD030_05805 [Pirellulales bacterium]